MLRFAIATAAVLAFAACGPDDSLPPSVPTVAADSGLPDSGLGYLEACNAAGCLPAYCEPLDGGAVRCGVGCGGSCNAACAQSRCPNPDGGWVDAFCNTSGASLVWSRDATCDDGNGCTKSDLCQNGTCAGTPNTGASCDDGNVCTQGDKCDGQGQCAGTKITNEVHRFFGPPYGNYIYGPSGFGTQFGYNDQGTIFQSIGSGDQPIYQLHDNGTDRLLSDAMSESGNYALDQSTQPAGKGFSSPLPHTVLLRRYKYPSGSGHCTNSADVACHLFTTNTGEKPSGSTEESTGIWVCPP
jgi:hypothetical protein